MVTNRAQARRQSADQREVEVGIWRRSTWTLHFWSRTIMTLGFYWLTYYQWNYIRVTNRRVTQHNRDFLGGNQTSVAIGEITDVSIDIPPMGDIFQYGHIKIQTAGTNKAEISFTRLHAARQLRDVIFDLQDGTLDEVY